VVDFLQARLIVINMQLLKRLYKPGNQSVRPWILSELLVGREQEYKLRLEGFMTVDDVLLHVSDRVARLMDFFVSIKIH